MSVHQECLYQNYPRVDSIKAEIHGLIQPFPGIPYVFWQVMSHTILEGACHLSSMMAVALREQWSVWSNQGHLPSVMRLGEGHRAITTQAWLSAWYPSYSLRAI